LLAVSRNGVVEEKNFILRPGGTIISITSRKINANMSNATVIAGARCTPVLAEHQVHNKSSLLQEASAFQDGHALL